MHLVSGAILSGKYKLVSALASGGMGCIWSARHETLDTNLAVKFIHPVHAASADRRRRFAREAVAAAKISSAHVVQVYDYGIEDDTPYLVMELLEGEDLGARLKREGRLSLEATCNILIQVAKGLTRAHEAGIIHRDLKPANLFLAREMDEEVVKILDFGIAKLTASPDMTGIGELVGSPLYMSPEQIQRLKTIDKRSDVWSLAVILFRAITGRPPFAGDDSADVIIDVLGSSIPRPSAIDPTLPPALDAFFERAFKREPSERFQSARETADAFVEAALGEPPSASSWSVVGLVLGPKTDVRSTPVPADARATVADAVTMTAPAPVAAPATVAAPVLFSKTLPSAGSPVDRPAALERTPAEKTTQVEIAVAALVAPPRRRLGSLIPWRVLGVSALLGFGLGWYFLPGPATVWRYWTQGVSSAMSVGSSMVRSVAEARDHSAADAMSGAETRGVEAAPADVTRPLDEPHSVLVNDSVSAANRTPMAEPASQRPKTRRH